MNTAQQSAMDRAGETGEIVFASGRRAAPSEPCESVPAPAGGWLPIETAPKDGSSVLTNDTTGLCQYCMSHWLAGEEWSGWVYDEEIANDSNPLGPQPTYFMRIAPLPTAPQSKEPQE